MNRLLENIFGWIEAKACRMKERFSICTDCGQNRYTGKPCKNIPRWIARTWNH